MSGEVSKPDNIKVLRGIPENVFNIEALRVMNMLPDWNVYYTRGKLLRKGFTVSIFFDEEHRRKYSQ